MKRLKYILVLLLGLTILLADCGGDDDWDITICPKKCPSTEPWVVNYLEVPPPCFKTKEECIEYALSHGFTADRCVKCDY